MLLVLAAVVPLVFAGGALALDRFKAAADGLGGLAGTAAARALVAAGLAAVCFVLAALATAVPVRFVLAAVGAAPRPVAARRVPTAFRAEAAAGCSLRPRGAAAAFVVALGLVPALPLALVFAGALVLRAVRAAGEAAARGLAAFVAAVPARAALPTTSAVLLVLGCVRPTFVGLSSSRGFFAMGATSVERFGVPDGLGTQVVCNGSVAQNRLRMC